MYTRATSIVALAITTACFVDNGGNATDASTSTGAASSTTGHVDPTTTTGASEPTTTSVDPSTTDATTGITPTDCIAQGPDNWPLMGSPLTDFKVEPVDPFITPNGLSLFYLDGATRRPYRTNRDSRDLPFPDGARLAEWAALPADSLPTYPTLILGAQVMFVSVQNDIHYSLYSPEDSDQYTLPIPLLGAVNTDFDETNMTATTDGLLLIVQRNDGPEALPLPFTYTFRQFTRDTADSAVPFTGEVDVTPKIEPFNLSACPVLSPDGLELYFTSTTGNELDLANPAHFGVYYTTRPARAEPWTTPVRVEGITTLESIVCATSISYDACSLAYFTVMFDDLTPPRSYLAERPPSP